MPESVRTAVVVGCGVIGMGWGVLFLSKGLKVIISDPVEGAEDNFKRYIQNAEFLFETRGDFERLSTNYEFVSDVIPRLAEADFVQEVCLPNK
jgi:3-hydroxyacyl-CoA dehydrogenase